jgi:anaerobic selenocysteine-containing dehydrogenase
MSKSTSTEPVTRRVACWLCEQPCRVLATIENNRITKVRTDPSIPWIKPYYEHGVEGCPKNRGFKEYLYNPGRLTHALKRVGKRGSGEWEQIPWEQAMDEIAAKLVEIRDKYGAEAVSATNGTYRTEQWMRFRFLNYFGTPNNVHVGHVCFCVNTVLQASTQGWFDFAFPAPGEYRSVMMWGHNAPWSWEKQWNSYKDNKEFPETKMITIDPVFTETARNSDIYSSIRPGSDCALALAMLRIILNEDLFDHEFVENWTNAPFLVFRDTRKLVRESDVVAGGSIDNFLAWDPDANRQIIWNSAAQEFKPASSRWALWGDYEATLADGRKANVCTVYTMLRESVDQWTPEEAAEVTWMTPDKIREVTKAFASGGRASSIPWGLAHNQNGRNTTYLELAKIIIRASMGSLDAPGGHYMGYSNEKFLNDTALEDNFALSKEQKDKQIGVDMYPLMSWETNDRIEAAQKRVLGHRTICMSESALGHPRHLWNAIITEKPYPIKALLCQAANPLMNFTDSKKVYEAIMSPNMELFVVHDYFMTPSAALADYVLPAATSYERDNFMSMGGAVDYVWTSEAAPTPEDWEVKDDFTFWRDLGVRCGQKDKWPWKTMREVIDCRAQSAGYKDFDDFMNSEADGCDFPEPEYYKYKKINPETGKPFGFATVSGKVEICPSILDHLGLTGFPEFQEPAESPYRTPELAREYPFILTTGARSLNYPYKHTEYRQVPNMRKMQKWPSCMMNPLTAAKLGTGVGQWVRIETPRGSIRQVVALNESLDPRIISIGHGFWYPEKTMRDPIIGGVFESNANVLTTDEHGYCDPFSGSYSMKALLCRIIPEPSFD